MSGCPSHIITNITNPNSFLFSFSLKMKKIAIEKYFLKEDKMKKLPDKHKNSNSREDVKTIENTMKRKVGYIKMRKNKSSLKKNTKQWLR